MTRDELKIVMTDGEAWIRHVDAVKRLGINQVVFLRAAVFGQVRVKIVGARALYHLADLEALAARRTIEREAKAGDAIHRAAMRKAKADRADRKAKREARRGEADRQSTA